MESNIFLIQTEKITLLIDAGSKEIFNVLNHDNIKNIDGILLTHGHADHIKQLNKLQKKYHCPVYLHFNDERLLRNS
ncbi:MBL fold metallo-hydrolase [bacterium]|nr:MBL fold metallo-hydrolase [bacterium]